MRRLFHLMLSTTTKKTPKCSTSPTTNSLSSTCITSMDSVKASLPTRQLDKWAEILLSSSLDPLSSDQESTFNTGMETDSPNGTTSSSPSQESSTSKCTVFHSLVMTSAVSTTTLGLNSAQDGCSLDLSIHSLVTTTETNRSLKSLTLSQLTSTFSPHQSRHWTWDTSSWNTTTICSSRITVSALFSVLFSGSSPKMMDLFTKKPSSSWVMLWWLLPSPIKETQTPTQLDYPFTSHPAVSSMISTPKKDWLVELIS